MTVISRVNDTVRVSAQMGILSDVASYILSQATNKSVLNVGAAGGVRGYLPHNKEIWMHYRLRNVARELVGIDIDQDGIRYAAKYGIEILDANCETMDLHRRFEVIVMSDVIEHLNAPASAIKTLVNHLEQGGKLLLTTPNPTHIGLLGRAVMGRELSIYYDHVGCFAPEHIQAICERFGYRMSQVYYFGHIDRRTRANAIKSIISRGIGRLAKRLSVSFLAVIERE